MFTEMKNRLDAAMEIMDTLKYLRDDVESAIKAQNENTYNWSTENLERYKASKEALDTVEKALEKFVKQ